jgi:hypothetical protein
MANGFERVEQFEKLMEEVDYYIDRPTSFLYEKIEDPTLQEIVECTRVIALNNLYYIQDKKEELEKIKKVLEQARDIQPSKTIEEERKTTIEPTSKKEYRDLSEVMKLIIYNCLSDETIKVLESLSKEDYQRIKLQIYKLIIETKKQIKLSILNNPIADIKQLQENLNNYELILEMLKDLELENKEEEELSQEYSNIIFAPNTKQSTYLYEDILEFPERTKEIKLILEKIVDGYFLRTKDTKAIEGYQENLYEYKHPNGIRVLYIVTGKIITICSLFMKDKQKSIKISSEYDEALSRYYNSISYIKDNFDNPDFHIEQAELVGEIFSLLDGVSLTKKVGE